MSLPFVQELTPAPSVSDALQALADWPNVVLFDSSLHRPELGRYSFLSADPFELFEQSADSSSDAIASMESVLESFPATTIPGLPPFQGGAAGLLTYELGQCFERLPVPEWDFLKLPRAVIAVYDWTLAWDHEQGRCWFIGHGYPEESDLHRSSRAECQWRSILKALSSGPARSSAAHGVIPERAHRPEGWPTFPFDAASGIASNFNHDGYLAAVQQVIDAIYAGDIFQANLSQQFTAPTDRSPIENYLSLRQQNPATFSGFFAHDDWAVLSSSPERFLKVKEGIVSTRPIKGTRQRHLSPEADLFMRDELRESEKDRAENVMIVDLMRNDLSRVCLPGTIQVTELCRVEVYETVAHLVSEVVGKLRPDATFRDLISATFPGGSITGAPKIRAMEIITEIEKTARGAYCGSLFYRGFDGAVDSSILIRTMTQRQGWLSLPAGGGIVAQSVPEQEYQETLHKVRGLLRAL